MVGAIESVTVGVGRLDEALALFRDLMQLRVDARFRASASVREAWRLAPGTQAEIVELSCRGYPVGRLRLVEYTPPATTRVRTHSGAGPLDHALDIGPKAIDFYVPAPMRRWYDAVLAAGYVARSEPVTHHVGDTISEEFVFWGPDGVPLLLMVGHRHAPDHMRLNPPDGPFSEVATISVVGADVASTRRFYEETLGLVALTNTETAEEFRAAANRLTGVPPETRTHWLLYAQPGEASGKILVVVFTPSQGKRLVGRMRPGRLGFSLLTHPARDLDALHARLERAGHAILTPPTVVDWNGTPRRLMLAEGPNEELFEFFERADAP
jgi:catechol 2,3-dioxygenase-like lactoylglutathione lyase family enzyme